MKLIPKYQSGDRFPQLKQYDPNIPRISLEEYQKQQEQKQRFNDTRNSAINTLTIGMNQSTSPNFRAGNASFNSTIGFNPSTALLVANPINTTAAVLGDAAGREVGNYFGWNPYLSRFVGGMVGGGLVSRPTIVRNAKVSSTPKSSNVTREMVNAERQRISDYYSSLEEKQRLLNIGLTEEQANNVMATRKKYIDKTLFEIRPLEDGVDGENVTINATGRNPINITRVNSNGTSDLRGTIAHEVGGHAATLGANQPNTSDKVVNFIIARNQQYKPQLNGYAKRMLAEGGEEAAFINYLNTTQEIGARLSEELLAQNKTELDKYFTKLSLDTARKNYVKIPNVPEPEIDEYT